MYMHVNKSNGKKYVGITSLPPRERWKRGKNYKGCLLFDRAIKKYGWDNFDHLIIAENLSKEEAEKAERYLISTYGSNNKDYGYNIANGGSSFGRHSEETKLKISKSKMGSTPWNKGITGVLHTNKGSLLSDDHKRKISEAKKKYHQDNPGNRAKKTICLDTMEVFDSCSDCADHFNIRRATMNNWLNNKNKGRTKYAFMYYEDYLMLGEDEIRARISESKTSQAHKDSKRVVCVSDGNVFESITKCGEFYGIRAKNLSAWLAGKYKCTHQYTFMYYDDYINQQAAI